MSATDDVFAAGQRLVASSDAVSSKLGDELALLDFRTNTYFTLNEAGAFVWTLLQSPRSPEELCEKMLETFDVDRQTCHADLSALLTDLRDAKLVAVHHDAAN